MKTYGTLKWNPAGPYAAARPVWSLDAEAHVLIRVRRILPRVRNAAGVVHIIDTPEMCAELRWICERWPMAMSDADRRHLDMASDEHATTVRAISEVSSGALVSRDLSTAVPLRDYQRTAVELVLRSRGLIVGDDLGLGKTAIAIGLISQPEARPAVVVTLTALPAQWKREIERFLPGIRVHIAKRGEAYDVLAKSTTGAFRMPDTDEERERFPDVFVLSYSKLAGWGDTLARVARSVTFDEAHELRNGEASNKGLSAKRIADSCDYRLGLTATPVFNYGPDMWQIANIIKPDGLGSHEEFVREWCAGVHDRVRDPAAFGTYLRDQGLYIRRTRAEVGRELPPLTVVQVPIEADRGALNEVRNVAAELARRILAREQSHRGDIMRDVGELDWRLRQATGLAKAPGIVAFVRMLVDQGEQVLLGGWHRAVYDVLASLFAAAGVRFAMYTGTESQPAKAEAVRAFVAGEIDVLIMSVRSGAGLDGLQHSRCRSVVIGELDWTPQVHRQFCGRIDRDGQKHGVFLYYLLTEFGSDPVVADVLGVKRMQALGIEDPAGVDLAPVEDADRARTLAESYLRSLGEIP